MTTSRIDSIIRDLQRLHADAQQIMDSHVDYLHCKAPSVPFGTLKYRAIAEPAGNTIDYVKALQIVKKGILSPG
jgi:hypothetical protein